MIIDFVIFSIEGLLESVNLVLKDVPAEEYYEYLQEYLKLVQRQKNYSMGQATGEVMFDTKIIFSVLTKPEL